jgi:hypothetical protein
MALAFIHINHMKSVGGTVRRTLLSLLAAGALTIGSGMPAAQAGVTCSWIPSMCPAPSNPGSGGGNSVPEPGTLGLLAMGVAASIGMLRRRKR